VKNSLLVNISQATSFPCRSWLYVLNLTKIRQNFTLFCA